MDRSSEKGMTLVAVMMVMAITTVLLLAVAPVIQQDIQREKELETIRRGEEIAEAISQYVTFYNGAKLPESMDDLLEGLPQGTKKRQILRASAAIDPLSEDGEWMLVKPDPETLAKFAKRVQDYNGGALPGNPSQVFDRYSLVLVNAVNTETEDDLTAPDEESDFSTDNTPFIGVVSKSKMRSVLSYYGVENHSKWVFTPLFRGENKSAPGSMRNTPPNQQTNQQPPGRPPQATRPISR